MTRYVKLCKVRYYYYRPEVVGKPNNTWYIEPVISLYFLAKPGLVIIVLLNYSLPSISYITSKLIHRWCSLDAAKQKSEYKKDMGC